MKRKGQLSIFLIIVIILIIGFGFIGYINSTEKKDNLDKDYSTINEGDKLALKSYVEDCIEQVVSEHLASSGDEIDEKINENLAECADFSAFPELDVTGGEVNSEVVNSEDGRRLIVNVNYPIKSSKGDFISDLDSFYVEYDYEQKHNLPPAGSKEAKIIYANDKKAKLIIPPNVVATDENGDKINEISFNMIDLNNVPTNLKPYSHLLNILDPTDFIAYEFGPEGATFNPPLTIEVETEISGESDDIYVGYMNPERNSWTFIPTRVEGNIVSAEISHFSVVDIHSVKSKLPVPDTKCHGADIHVESGSVECFKSDGSFITGNQVNANEWHTGDIFVKDISDEGQTRKYTDVCNPDAGTNEVFEFTCGESNSNQFDAVAVPCTGGSSCSGGKCVGQSEPICTKSDMPVDGLGNQAGINRRVSGCTYVNGAAKDCDKCDETSGLLLEAVCENGESKFSDGLNSGCGYEHAACSGGCAGGKYPGLETGDCTLTETPGGEGGGEGCSGCMPCFDCNGACRAAGNGDIGGCAMPGSTDPGACCVCYQATGCSDSCERGTPNDGDKPGEKECVEVSTDDADGFMETIYDTCVDDKLYEVKCDGSSYKFKVYECSEGCTDGVCNGDNFIGDSDYIGDCSGGSGDGTDDGSGNSDCSCETYADCEGVIASDCEGGGVYNIDGSATPLQYCHFGRDKCVECLDDEDCWSRSHFYEKCDIDGRCVQGRP